LCESSKDLPPAGLGLTPSKSYVGRIRQHLLRFFADRFLFAAPTQLMTRILGSYGIKANGANVFDILYKKATVVLQSGTPGFEYERSDLSTKLHFAGPLLPYSKSNKRDQWYDARLQQYKHVVLVTQGTVETDIEKLLVPTLEAFKNSNVLVVATTGGSQTEALRKRFPDKNFIIEDFVPFDDVMPYADVYVTNGGYGGVLLSIRNKLPMVVAGVHEGKNEINARVGYFKLGINLKTETPKPVQIRRAVDEIFGNDIYTRNTRKLCEEFSRHNPNEICLRHVSRLVIKTRLTKSKKETLIY
jgi:UDP:flavonoid glycosyltransferase YjiC (YdhE family)